GDGYLRSRRGARLWTQDRRRHAGCRARRPEGHRRLSRCGARMNFFIEVVAGGLLAGVMYSLVALGFVIIYKASGVFNFAQGSLVFFAALIFVSLMERGWKDRKSTRLNSSHRTISYAVFCLKKKKINIMKCNFDY